MIGVLINVFFNLVNANLSIRVKKPDLKLVFVNNLAIAK